MAYYTLTTKGRAWLEDDAPGPAKYSKVLAALGELILENDVPRTASQVSHIAEIPEKQSSEGLTYLTASGYVKPAPIPQPSEPLETPKIRIKPIEELAVAEIKREAARERYTHGEKGIASRRKYQTSDKGKIARATYWGGVKGKLAQKLHRLNRRHRELNAFLASHPEEKDKIQPLIDSITAQIQALEKQRQKLNKKEAQQ